MTTAPATTTVKIPIDANRFANVLDNYTVKQAEAFQWLYELIIEKQLTYAEAGKMISRDGGNISKIFNGKYAGNLDAWVATIQTFRDDYTSKNGASTPDFVMTEEAKKIFFACSKASKAREVALIYGDLGIGKTKSAVEYCKRNPKSIYYRCEAAQPFGAFIRSFARSLGLTQTSIYSLRTEIIARLRRKKTDLIFVDEFTLPFTTTNDRTALKCAEFIRDLNDELDCGIVLCGTKILPQKLNDSQWSDALGQIIDRGNTIVNLRKRKTIKGLEEFFSFYELHEPPTEEARTLMNDILSAHSIRKLTFCLRDGARAAANKKQPYTWEHFVDAYVINQSLNQ